MMLPGTKCKEDVHGGFHPLSEEREWSAGGKLKLEWLLQQLCENQFAYVW